MEALGKTPRWTRVLHAMGYLALAAGLGLWAAQEARDRCDGQLIAPLDDTYIHFQYAQAAALGRPFEYQEGAEPTRGATSLLYPLVLAPFAASLPPQNLMVAAWLLGVLCLAGTALAGHAWARSQLGRGAGPAAGIGILLSGPLVWGALSGMEVGLFAFAVTGMVAASAWYLDAASPRSGLRRMAVLAFFLALTALTRPEGILLAGAVAALLPFARRAPNSSRARWSLLLVPAMAAALTAGINLAVLGHLGSNTLEAKAVWSEMRPDVQEGIYRRLPWVLWRITLALFTGYYTGSWGVIAQHVLRALLLGGGLLGAAALLRRGGAPGRILVATLFLGLLAGLIPVGFNSHYHRYQLPFTPLATLLVIAGWWRIQPRGKPWLALGVLGLAGCLLVPGLVRQMDFYGRNASDIYRHQVTMGHWIRGNLPETATVAINDAGAIPYFGERRVIDLVGLVSNGPALPNRAGEASLFEWLERLPAGERPTHFAIFPTWFPYLFRTSLVGRQLIRYHLPDRTISGAESKGVFLADWSGAGRGDEPVARGPLLELWGFAVQDRLDVADLESETGHGYRAFPSWRATLREFPVADREDIQIIDGGKQPFRGETFTLACRPGEPAALVLRTEAFAPFTLRVSVDGDSLGVWRIPAQPQAWTEPLFEIPATALTRPRAEFTLTRIDTTLPYPAFYYWLLQ